jgi:FtsP/CotA-like multicopper oxidase with cupredoxin domain
MYEDKLPGLADFAVFNHPTALTIQVEARKAKLNDSTAPSAINAWCYVAVSKPKKPGAATLQNYLGPIINVKKGKPLEITWVNTLGGMMMPQPMQEMPPINPIDMEFPNWVWKGMNPSVGIVTHLHGAKVDHKSDGWPLDPVGYVGSTPTYGFPTSRTYAFPNDQRAAMLWFHDHAMDNTAVQVHAGLAGLYFVRDKSDKEIFDLIGGAGQEVPLVIQDRNVDCGYQSFNYWAGVPTDVSVTPDDGFVRPEFLGETLYVNGRPSPCVEVERAIYRLRVLNGSNARTYALALIDPAVWSANPPKNSRRIWYSDCLSVIGNDGGLLSKSFRLKNPAFPSTNDHYILIAPGERLDLLLDLTGVERKLVSCLRLVNLSLNSLRNDPFPEAIFQTEEPITNGTDTAASSVLQMQSQDDELLTILTASQANILQLCLGPKKPAKPLDVAKLDAILKCYAADDGFQLLPSGELGPVPTNAPIARNRFVLLMNDTNGFASDLHAKVHDCPQTGERWRDTQIWELTTVPNGKPPFNVPFAVDTEGATPSAGAPSAARPYYVARSTFFETFPPARLIDGPAHAYAKLHEPTFRPAGGSYERWYVANIGNSQPDVNAIEPGGAIPDAHPFHMHLVNFVVTRRWRLQGALPAKAAFVDTTGGRVKDFDKSARHDTTRIQSGELVELLVYFPKDYKGRYPYHCHLVEHEDMGMMLHFETV